jgi:hypothetical protein
MANQPADEVKIEVIQGGQLLEKAARFPRKTSVTGLNT